MKKIIFSLLFILSFGSYALYQNQAVQDQVVALTPVTTARAVVAKAPPSSVPPQRSLAVSGKYKNGTYTGTSVNAYYGNVQVQVVVQNGKIADIAFLDYPQDRGTSRSINSSAMPQLKQEALRAQSAQVNGVSGASDTSVAFEQSLSSALSQAA